MHECMYVNANLYVYVFVYVNVNVNAYMFTCKYACKSIVEICIYIYICARLYLYIIYMFK